MNCEYKISYRLMFLHSIIELVSLWTHDLVFGQNLCTLR